MILKKTLLLGSLFIFGSISHVNNSYAIEISQDLNHENKFVGKQFDNTDLQQEIENILLSDERQKGIISDIVLDSLAELLYSIIYSNCTDFAWNIVGWGNISTSGPYGYLKEEGITWLKEFKKKDMYTTVREGEGLFSYIKLHASYIQNGESKKTVVIHHGYRGPTEAVAVYAKMFYEMGYNVLLPDSRATGESQGKNITFGWKEKEDIVHWINQLPVDQEVILMGESMGAATVLMASGLDNFPQKVKAVISDSSYSSLDQQIQFLYNIANDLVNGKIPQKVLNILDGKVKKRLNFSMSDVSVINQVKKSKIPMFFIHGESDSFVPSNMVQQLYDAKLNGEKQLFIVQEANHTQAISYAYPMYKEQIKKFTNIVIPS